MCEMTLLTQLEHVWILCSVTDNWLMLSGLQLAVPHELMGSVKIKPASTVYLFYQQTELVPVAEQLEVT